MGCGTRGRIPWWLNAANYQELQLPDACSQNCQRDQTNYFPRLLFRPYSSGRSGLYPADSGAD